LARLELGGEEALVDLVADVDQRVPFLGGDAAAYYEVAGVVDRRLGPERAALLRYCLTLEAW
jgi:hypothetical protein